jgi:HEAT repeat protein
MACFGFYVLGGIGKDAVPALMDLLDSTNTHVRLCAVSCLGNIGPPAKAAVPLLVRFMNDPNKYARFGTTVTLMRIHEDAALVVPVLITNLTESNVILPTTILALASFGDRAKPAVPALLRFLGDKNDFVREAATNALKAIDPEAAAKAGVK